MIKDVTRCNSCLVPRDTEGFYFDANGTCSLCVEHFNKPRLSDNQDATISFNQDIEAIIKRGKNAPFDCIVGVSGGTDSIYLLRLLTHKHNLRCLAVYYRTPFTPAEIDDNVKKITSLLSVPLVEMNLSQDFHRKVAAYFVKLWKNNHNQILVNLACAPCKLLHREMFRIAKQYDVQTIIHGDNKYEHANIAAGQFRSNAKNRYSFGANLLRIFVIAARGIAVIVKNPGVLRHLGVAFKASILYLNPYSAFLSLRYPAIHVFNYFHEGVWNEQELNQTLDDLGWQLPNGFHSNKKSDCTFAHLKNVMTSKSVGADYFDLFFSNMVRFGLIERGEALERLQREGQPADIPIRDAYNTLKLPENYINLKP
jgi:hypothetical protein